MFAARETKRTIVLVSTSGGSGGDAGARTSPSPRAALHGAVRRRDRARRPRRRRQPRKPIVVPFSDGFGLGAPAAAADGRRRDRPRERAATRARRARSASSRTWRSRSPPANRACSTPTGCPPVLVQVVRRTRARRRAERGERANASKASAARVLSAVDALDVRARHRHRACRRDRARSARRCPAWALRLLSARCCSPPLVAVVDGLARLRRRRRPVGALDRCGRSAARCRSSAARCSRYAARARSGIIGAAPPVPVLAGALPFDAARPHGACWRSRCVLLLAWLLWRRCCCAGSALRARSRPRRRARAGDAARAAALVARASVWAVEPVRGAAAASRRCTCGCCSPRPELRPRRPRRAGAASRSGWCRSGC